MARSNVIKMSEAIGKVERISKAYAVDEAGNKIQTNSKGANVGAGQGKEGDNQEYLGMPMTY